MTRCSNFSTETIKNIPFSAATELGSLEKHENAITFLTIFMRVKDLLSTLGVEDFSIWDMMFPETKRIKRIFAEIAAYMNYRNQEIKTFENFFEINVFFLYYCYNTLIRMIWR